MHERLRYVRNPVATHPIRYIHMEHYFIEPDPCNYDIELALFVPVPFPEELLYYHNR